MSSTSNNNGGRRPVNPYSSSRIGNSNSNSSNGNGSNNGSYYYYRSTSNADTTNNDATTNNTNTTATTNNKNPYAVSTMTTTTMTVESARASAWNNAVHQAQTPEDVENSNNNNTKVQGNGDTAMITATASSPTAPVLNVATALPPSTPTMATQPEPPFFGTPWLPPPAKKQNTNNQESTATTTTPTTLDTTLDTTMDLSQNDNNNNNSNSTSNNNSNNNNNNGNVTTNPPQTQPQQQDQQQNPQQQTQQHLQQHLQLLQQQVQALQQELAAKSEINFDLSATISAMEAEQQYTISTIELKAKQDLTKLKGELRLEQQTKQRLLEETALKRQRILTLEKEQQQKYMSTTSPSLSTFRQNREGDQTSLKLRRPPVPPVKQVSIPVVVRNINRNESDTVNDTIHGRGVVATSPKISVATNNNNNNNARTMNGNGVGQNTNNTNNTRMNDDNGHTTDNGNIIIITDDETRSLALHLLHISYTITPTQNHNGKKKKKNFNNDQADLSSIQQVLSGIAYGNTVPPSSRGYDNDDDYHYDFNDDDDDNDHNDKEQQQQQQQQQQWTLLQLAEYLLTTTAARLVWLPMLQASRKIRQAIVQAMLTKDKSYNTTSNDNNNNNDNDNIATSIRRRSRITPLVNNNNNNNNNGRQTKMDKHQQHNQQQPLILDPTMVYEWIQIQVTSKCHPVEILEIMSTLLVEDVPHPKSTISTSSFCCNVFWRLFSPRVMWIVKAVHRRRAYYADKLYRERLQQQRRRRRRRQQMNYSTGSSSMYRRRRRLPIPSYPADEPNKRVDDDDDDDDDMRVPSDALADVVVLPSADRYSTTDGDDYDDQLLAAAFGLLERLIQITHFKTIEVWYNPHDGSRSSSSGGGGRAPLLFSDYFDAQHPPEEDMFVEQFYARGLQLTCRLLDLYDFLVDGSSSTNDDDDNDDDDDDDDGDEEDKKATLRSNHSSQSWYQQDLPVWYWKGISLLTAMARSMPLGMEVVRTRVVDLATLPDGQGGSWMPNALDVAIQHMFAHSFSSLENDMDDAGAPIVAPILRRQRQAAIEGWVRLFHQTLFFIQQEQQHKQQQQQQQQQQQANHQDAAAAAAVGPQKQSTSSSKSDISFRSLVLDHQDYYTAACARFLTDSSIRPEIQAMIRAQLEELALDEDEHDDIQLNIKQVRQ